MQILGLSDSTPKPTSRFRELFWPNLTTEPAAQSACETAALACFVIAGITTIFAFFTTFLTLIDALLFLMIGLGLRKAWRTAALAGFGLYIVEQAAGIMQGKFPGVLTLLFLVILFNGVRASFGYRRMHRTDEPSRSPVNSNLAP